MIMVLAPHKSREAAAQGGDVGGRPPAEAEREPPSEELNSGRRPSRTRTHERQRLTAHRRPGTDR